MKAYIDILPEHKVVEVRMLAEGPDGTIGDAMRVVKPGEEYRGWTYAALVKHGPGEIEV
jgi:hypothetical protein